MLSSADFSETLWKNVSTLFAGYDLNHTALWQRSKLKASTANSQ